MQEVGQSVGKGYRRLPRLSAQTSSVTVEDFVSDSVFEEVMVVFDVMDKVMGLEMVVEDRDCTAHSPLIHISPASQPTLPN